MKKSKIAAGILGIVLGAFGVHKFYLGKYGAGILSILFFWTGIPSIIGMIEGILYLCMSDAEFSLKTGFDVQALEINSTNTTSRADEILKWKRLYESGDITLEEYEKKKRQLLDL